MGISSEGRPGPASRNLPVTTWAPAGTRLGSLAGDRAAEPGPVTTWTIGRAPGGHHPMAQQWMTYADAATTLGMSVEGLRQRARREHWRRQIGNDGRAMVMIPDDTTRRPAGDPPGNPPNDRPATRRAPSEPPAGAIEALQARVAELRADLEHERAERHQERERADKLAAELADATRRLGAIVDEVRDAERARGEAEQRAALLEAGRQSDRETADARAEAIRAELMTLVEAQTQAARHANTQLQEIRSRPWWKRLAG